MKAINIVQLNLAFVNLRMLLSCLAGTALLVLAIYAVSTNPETDASSIISSLVSP